MPIAFLLKNCFQSIALISILLITVNSANAANNGELNNSHTFTSAQFENGESLYRQHCQSCHGKGLEGGSASSLSGNSFVDAWSKVNVSVDDLFYTIRSNMPPGNITLLEERNYLSILAYILGHNGVLAGNEALTTDSGYLASIVLSKSGEAGSTREFIRGIAGIKPKGKGPTAQMLKNADADPENWLYHTHNYSGTRYSPVEQINRNNAAGLQVVCLQQLGGEGDFQTGPLVYDGTMYLTSGGDTIAIDAVNCNEKWRHQWQYQQQAIQAPNRGVAIKDGYVVRGTNDGYLIAIDALDGQLLWARKIAESSEGEHFTMAPLIYGNSILIGPAGSHYGISGWVAAFNLIDGERIWRFNTVPNMLPEKSDLSINSFGVKIGGGAVWTPLSLDVENEALYVAVTNPSPAFPAILQAGDSLYTNSVLSLDINTGTLNWYKQLISTDDHGWDLTQVSPLYNIKYDAYERKAIATAGKDGLLRVFDRTSQEKLFETAIARQLNVAEPVAVSGTYTCPGVLGGVLWNGPAFNPIEQLLITPSVNLCATFYRAKEARYTEGVSYFDGTVVSDPSTLSGWLSAVNSMSGELSWQFESELPMVAAVTTTAGGLVLAGELTGDFIVLDSSNGELLYRFYTGGAIGGGIISYSVDGKQYLAVATGRPSVSQVNGKQGSPTLIVFALP